MNERIRGATVWVLLAVFAVAVLVGFASTLNTARTTTSDSGAAVNDVATTSDPSGSSGGELSPVELGILNDLGYMVTNP